MRSIKRLFINVTAQCRWSSRNAQNIKSKPNSLLGMAYSSWRVARRVVATTLIAGSVVGTLATFGQIHWENQEALEYAGEARAGHITRIVESLESQGQLELILAGQDKPVISQGRSGNTWATYNASQALRNYCGEGNTAVPACVELAVADANFARDSVRTSHTAERIFGVVLGVAVGLFAGWAAYWYGTRSAIHKRHSSAQTRA